jgi:hypothetical protein
MDHGIGLVHQSMADRVRLPLRGSILSRWLRSNGQDERGEALVECDAWWWWAHRKMVDRAHGNDE